MAVSFLKRKKSSFPSNSSYPHIACGHGQGARILHFHLGYTHELPGMQKYANPLESKLCLCMKNFFL